MTPTLRRLLALLLAALTLTTAAAGSAVEDAAGDTVEKAIEGLDLEDGLPGSYPPS